VVERCLIEQRRTHEILSQIKHSFH